MKISKPISEQGLLIEYLSVLNTILNYLLQSVELSLVA